MMKRAVMALVLLMAFSGAEGEKKGSALPVIKTVDGFTLSYRIYLPTLKGDETDRVKPPFAVIFLVHDYGGSKVDWSIGTEHLPGVLTKAGYAVVVFDLRGHGETVHQEVKLQRAANLPREVLEGIGKDFEAMWQGLKGLDYLDLRRVGIVASGWTSAQVVAYLPGVWKPGALAFATPRTMLFRWEEGLMAKNVSRWKGVPVWVGACKDAPGFVEVEKFISAFPSGAVERVVPECKTPAYGTFLFMSEGVFRERLRLFLEKYVPPFGA